MHPSFNAYQIFVDFAPWLLDKKSIKCRGGHYFLYEGEKFLTLGLNSEGSKGYWQQREMGPSGGRSPQKILAFSPQI